MLKRKPVYQSPPLLLQLYSSVHWVQNELFAALPITTQIDIHVKRNKKKKWRGVGGTRTGGADEGEEEVEPEEGQPGRRLGPCQEVEESQVGEQRHGEELRSDAL